MAVGGRRRRRRKPWWLLFGVLLSLVVLLVNAAVSARSKGPSERLAALAYLDEVRPSVERSTELGGELRQVRTDAAKLGRDGVNRRLDRVHDTAERVLGAVRAAEPPPPLKTQHSLLVAALAMRARATSTVTAALVQALGTDPPAAAIDALVGAGEDISAADRAYDVFLSGLPKAEGVDTDVMPPSRWRTDEHEWARPELTIFVNSLRSSSTLAPVHDLAVVLVSTEPSPVGSENGALVLPALNALRLQIVVANAGNETEKRVTVVATVTPAEGAGTPDTARDFVDLLPGQRQALTLGGLRIPPVGVSTLTVVIGPVEGETTVEDNTKTLTILVR